MLECQNQSLKENDLIDIIYENIKLLKQIDLSINIYFKHFEKKILFFCDSEQLNRVFLNLIKNSIESIQEKSLKNAQFC